MATDDTHRKFGEVQTRASGDMLANINTERQINRPTDMLMTTSYRFPAGDGVTSCYARWLKAKDWTNVLLYALPCHLFSMFMLSCASDVHSYCMHLMRCVL